MKNPDNGNGNGLIVSLKMELAKLEDEAKLLSKRIGQEKRAGNDANALIAEKKALHQEKMAPIEKAIAEASEKTKFDNQPTSNSPHSKKARANEHLLSPPAPYPKTDGELAHEEKEKDVTKINVEMVELNDASLIAEAWDTYVQSHPSGNIYYSRRFLEEIHQIFGHPIKLFTASNVQTNELLGVLPVIEQKSFLFGHLWTSIAFVNYGGPLCDSEQIESLVIQHVQQAADQTGVKRIELRGLYQRPVNSSWSVSQEKTSMWLALPKDNNSDTLLKSFKAKLRSQILKGYTDEISVKIGSTELVNDYYAVFARNMRDLGTPVYSKRLFSGLLEALEGQAWVVLIYHQGKPASAAFLIKTGDRIEIPWASTIREYNRFGLNMVLYWEVLKLSCEQKCAVFDFGRSSIDASTYKFKKQWGTQPIQHYWYGYEPSENISGSAESSHTENSEKVSTDNQKFQLLIACWKRLPIWLSKLIGPSIVKFIP